MKPSNFAKIVDDLLDNPTKRPIMCWGPPGIGKSSVVTARAKKRNRRVLDWRLVQKEAIDITGLPFVKDGTTRYASPEMLPKEGEGCVLFLDEIVQAPVMVQNAVSELVLDRTLGGGTYRLPDDACIIAAGNNRSDRAGTFEMPTHMRSRFRHFDLEVDTDDWAAWAFANGIREEVIAFVRFRPNMLFNLSTTDRVSPNPRTWAAVSEDMEFAAANRSLQFETFKASLGDGPSSEFVGYLRTFSEMPDPDEVFSSPETAPVPTQPGVMWALGVALASRVNSKTAEALFTYLPRLSQDFAIVIATDAIARDKRLITGRAATQWATKHAKFLVGM
jgi:hypothetical protein